MLQMNDFAERFFCMKCLDTLHCLFVPKIIWVKILMFLIMPIYKDKWNWFRWSVAFILMGTGHLKLSTFILKQFPWLFVLGWVYYILLCIRVGVLYTSINISKLNKRFSEEQIYKLKIKGTLSFTHAFYKKIRLKAFLVISW